MTRPKLKPHAEPTIIGWREHVCLPDFGHEEFVAKMDTGAEYCALHATRIRIKLDRVSFRLDSGKTMSANLVREIEIKSSNGETSIRPLVRIRIMIGAKTIVSSVTLIDRSKMQDKMLLGRKLLRNRFIIDPRLSYALKLAKKRKLP
jgi:hypothetical protein